MYFIYNVYMSVMGFKNSFDSGWVGGWVGDLWVSSIQVFVCIFFNFADPLRD